MPYSLLEAKPIEELCKVVDCEHKTAPYVDESDYLVVRTSNVRDGQLVMESMKYTTLEGYNEWTSRAVPEYGDVLFTREAPAGESCLVPSDTKVCMGQRMVMLRPHKSEVDPVFLSMILNTERTKNDIYRLSIGSTVSRINIADIRKLKVASPPLPEQQKIAKILSTWDKAISTTERLIENSTQQKKALMQQLLTGKKRLLDESGKRFEGEWEEVKLKGCANSLDNLRVPINSEQRQEMSGHTPYWGANGIVGYINDYIFNETIVLLAEDGGYFDEFASRPIANISYGKSWVNNHAHVLTAKDNTINEWLYYSLVNKNILAFINGGTRAKLNKSDMFLIPILIPPLKEQQKIVTVLTNADKEIELLEQQLADLQQEKKALMQVLLTGKVRVLVDGKVA